MCDAREYVHRIGDDEDIPRESASFQLVQDGKEDGAVAFDEIQPRFARLLVGARRDDRHGRIGGVRIVSRPNVHRFGKEQAVRDVLRLPFGAGCVGVDEYHFRVQSVLHERKGAHAAPTNPQPIMTTFLGSIMSISSFFGIV